MSITRDAFEAHLAGGEQEEVHSLGTLAHHHLILDVARALAHLCMWTSHNDSSCAGTPVDRRCVCETICDMLYVICVMYVMYVICDM